MSIREECFEHPRPPPGVLGARIGGRFVIGIDSGRFKREKDSLFRIASGLRCGNGVCKYIFFFLFLLFLQFGNVYKFAVVN